MTMSNIPALITWAGLSMVATIGAVLVQALNLKEKIAVVSLTSGASAAILCGFTIGVSWGLGAAAGVLIGISLLMGYEG
tara:strand:- start:5173 stop:5409 length:237 start_codon:yes stop_codon:yes gene_type:complete